MEPVALFRYSQSLRFFFYGERIDKSNASITPASLGLVDGDVVDVFQYSDSGIFV